MDEDERQAVKERARQIREQDGPPRAGEEDRPRSPRLTPEQEDVVEANREMKQEIGGAGSDPGLAAGLAASGVRTNSSDRVKHSGPGGKDSTIDESKGLGPGGRYSAG